MLSLDFPGAPYGDVCRTCNDQVAYSPVAVQAWHGTGGRFAYACRAGHAWGCGLAALQPVAERFAACFESTADADGPGAFGAQQ